MSFLLFFFLITAKNKINRLFTFSKFYVKLVIMKIMGDEYDKIDEFESKYETETDKVIEQKVIDELEQVQ